MRVWREKPRQLIAERHLSERTKRERERESTQKAAFCLLEHTQELRETIRGEKVD
jgi:hypothetical protein